MISNGMWFRHSTQQGGVSALDFLVKVLGVHFMDAVLSLTRGYPSIDYKLMPKVPAPVSSITKL
jgi:translation elongation factor EF-4